MTEPKSLLKELDEAVAHGTAESRMKALWYATDVLLVGRYSEQDIWIFGEVIDRLAGAIEIAARAQLAERLATSSNAPIKVVNRLAFDDSIDVAGPILQHCEKLDARTLVRNIRTKSQPHLLAISKRNSIPSVVTDELVTRGDQQVITSVAANHGACVSDFGFLHMIRRSANDSILAEHLGLRKDIPRQMFQQLIAKASDDVRRKLEQERPDLLGQIQNSVVEVAGSLQSKFGPATESYFDAKKAVTALHHAGQLNEDRILDYARNHKIQEATVGLSLLCSLPVSVVERALIDPEMTLVLAKACNFTWDTAMSLLFLGARDHRIYAGNLDRMKKEFSQLDAKTPQEILSFYHSRRDTQLEKLERRRLPQTHAV